MTASTEQGRDTWGLPPMTYEPPPEVFEAEPRRDPWWLRWPLAIPTLGFLATLALFAVVLGIAIDAFTSDTVAPAQTRSHWTEPDGRHCTAVQAGEAVAVSCAYPPAESRLSNLLGGTP